MVGAELARWPSVGSVRCRAPSRSEVRRSHPCGVVAELPDRTSHKYCQPGDQVEHPRPLEMVGQQGVVHELIEPVQRGECRHDGVVVGEMSDRDEKAARKAASRQDERDDLCDVLSGQQIPEEEWLSCCFRGWFSCPAG